MAMGSAHFTRPISSGHRRRFLPGQSRFKQTGRQGLPLLRINPRPLPPMMVVAGVAVEAAGVEVATTTARVVAVGRSRNAQRFPAIFARSAAIAS